MEIFDKHLAFVVLWNYYVGMKKIPIAKYLLLAVLTVSFAAGQTKTIKRVPVQPTAALDGKTLFSQYCAVCHGVAGNAELLIQASRVFNDTNDMAAADRVGQLGIEWYRRNDLPWPCGVPGGGETPNLMLGLAGMGYFFLRLAEPSSVPSVLFISEENQAKAVH